MLTSLFIYLYFLGKRIKKNSLFFISFINKQKSRVFSLMKKSQGSVSSSIGLGFFKNKHSRIFSSPNEKNLWYDLRVVFSHHLILVFLHLTLISHKFILVFCITILWLCFLIVYCTPSPPNEFRVFTHVCCILTHQINFELVLVNVFASAHKHILFEFWSCSFPSHYY